MTKRIYIKEWLDLKPYNHQTRTDTYYLKLSNEVKKNIVQKSSMLEFLDEDGLSYLSCFLTSYLEDIISKTNIWTSFITLHKRLYNKELPFYILDEYFENEINIQDVSFLIWYFINTIQEEEFIAPFNKIIIETALIVMDVLDNAWEQAPENNHLIQFYQIEEKEEDFYIARKLIDKILLQTYLFHPDAKLKLIKEEKKIIEENKDAEKIISYLQENRDEVVHKTHTKLLNLKGKEWASEILGKNHPLSDDFLNISQRIRGLFLYKGQDASNLFIEYIASGKKFQITKKSFDHSDILQEVDTILYMGIVKWKNEWWFTGIFTKMAFDADIILDEKNSFTSRVEVNFLDHEDSDTEQHLQQQFEIFKEFNNGSQIAFISSDKIQSFTDKYIKYYNDSFNFTKKQKKDALNNIRKEGFFGSNEKETDYSEISDSGLVFFNPKSGVEIALDSNSAFPLSNNPFFDVEKSREDIMFLIASDDFSKELAMFCIENCKNDLPFFNEDVGAIYLEDIDFLMRYWKGNNYFAEPTITYIGKRDS